ncbi:hypothetical protein [Alicyclobacillus fodiniaquatilis]|jgi:hypothetical protein|uniref:Uncharacterized protein n=1 Tax=Alicyclobacillus fodiniaquatilis TaxID=1661150 RepID=A0ABW4JFK1_9BACL
MARFERLRWVPMLIRAYYDAQLRREGPETISAQKPEVLTVKTIQQKSTPIATKRTHKTQNSQKRKNAKKQNSRKKTQRISHDPTVQLLRELRAANHKLKEIDAIREQLNDLGSSLHHFQRRVEKLDSTEQPTQDAP